MAFTDRLHNRGSISGYDIDNSLKLEADNTEYLSKTPSSAGNQKTWTFSAWVKRTELGLTSSKSAMIFGSGDTYLHFISNDKLIANLRTGGTNFFYYSERMFRDTSAWYHFVLACDTTQSTASNRLKLYVNGVYESPTESNGYTNIAQNADTGINSTNEHEIGKYTLDETTYAEFFSGYMAEMHLVDGTALAPTDFGEFDDDSGIWKPKAYTGSYGTNGFYLDFEDASNLGNDASGGTDFTETNITSADQATDTPTNNFTTFNTLRRYNQGWVTFKEGATNVITGSGNNWTTIFNTMAVNKGKWYFEGEVYSNEITQMFGQTPQPWTELNVHTAWYLGARADKQEGAAYYCSGDDVYYEGGYVNSSASTGGDIISVAMDCDNNKVHFAVNGVYTNSSDPANNTNGFAMLDDYQYFATAIFPGGATWKYNFGGYTTISISSAASDANGYGTFEYAPPSGYYALCTKNLAEYG